MPTDPPVPPVRLALDVSGDPLGSADIAEAHVRKALQRAAFEGAEMVRATWVAVAQGLGLSSTGSYINGINASGNVSVAMTESGPDLTASVAITNTAQNADIIENGHGAYSLPQAIRWGQTPRQKRFKDGTPYLVIPFRHGAYRSVDEQVSGGTTPQGIRRMMPQSVYSQAKRLAPTERENVGPQYRNGQFVAADRYRWGGRLSDPRRVGETVERYGRKDTPRAQAMGQKTSIDARRDARVVGVDRDGNALHNPAWTASRWSGMVRVKGGRGHTEYLTFRIITPKSKGWRIPARAGYGIVAKLTQNLEGGTLGRTLAELTQEYVGEAIAEVLRTPPPKG